MAVDKTINLHSFIIVTW